METTTHSNSEKDSFQSSRKTDIVKIWMISLCDPHPSPTLPLVAHLLVVRCCYVYKDAHVGTHWTHWHSSALIVPQSVRKANALTVWSNDDSVTWSRKCFSRRTIFYVENKQPRCLTWWVLRTPTAWLLGKRLKTKTLRPDPTWEFRTAQMNIVLVLSTTPWPLFCFSCKRSGCKWFFSLNCTFILCHRWWFMFKIVVVFIRCGLRKCYMRLTVCQNKLNVK